MNILNSQSSKDIPSEPSIITQNIDDSLIIIIYHIPSLSFFLAYNLLKSVLAQVKTTICTFVHLGQKILDLK